MKTAPFLERYAAEIAGWRILEPGPADGRYTVALARRALSVVAVEPREGNVATVRKAAEWLVNVAVVQADATQYVRQCEPFDAVFHSGVLYHLTHPVRHLHDLARVAPRLWLDTHVADGGPRDDEAFRGRAYPAYRRAESRGEPRSGLHPFARWLSEGSLLAALDGAGYAVRVVSRRVEKNGPRITLECEQCAPS